MTTMTQLMLFFYLIELLGTLERFCFAERKNLLISIALACYFLLILVQIKMFYCFSICYSIFTTPTFKHI